MALIGLIIGIRMVTIAYGSILSSLVEQLPISWFCCKLATKIWCPKEKCERLIQAARDQPLGVSLYHVTYLGIGSESLRVDNAAVRVWTLPVA